MTTEAQAAPLISLRGIHFAYPGGAPILKHLDFDLFPGEICALLGENGAGKTTLMNILFGYYACDKGEITIKGEKVYLSSPKDAIARGVGMIHQHFTLVPSQTVLENIIVGTKTGKGLVLDLE